MCPNPQFPEDLVTFTEEILNGKLHFLREEEEGRRFCWTMSKIEVKVTVIQIEKALINNCLHVSKVT